MFDTRFHDPSQPMPILDQLTTEWRHLCITTAQLATVRGWLLPGGEVYSLDDVLARSGYIAARPPDQHRLRTARDGRGEDEVDAYLLRLLTLARTESLAGRIILQRILPALCTLSRRHATARLPQAALLDELVANAWAVIHSYPVERRPHRVIANLVRDVGFQTIVRPTRRRHASELPTSHDGLEHTAETTTEPLAELIDLLRAARRSGALDDREMDLICKLVSRGRPEIVAAELGVTSRTVRNHRDAIVHRLRGFVAAA